MTTRTTSYADTLRARAASRTSAYGDSIWYTLHELRQHHADPIYFGDGAPAAEAMPVHRLRQAAAHAWEEAPAALGYGESEGFAPLRQYIADWMKPRTRSEYFSISIPCLQSMSGPLRGAGQAKGDEPALRAVSRLHAGYGDRLDSS